MSEELKTDLTTALANVRDEIGRHHDEGWAWCAQVIDGAIAFVNEHRSDHISEPDKMMPLTLENGFKITNADGSDIDYDALGNKYKDRLCYCDIDGFYIGQDGQLILMDDCGKAVEVDRGDYHIEVSQSADTGKMVPIALDELREMDGEPVWCDWMNAWAFVNIDGAREINFTYRDGSQNTFCELAGFCGKYGKKWAAYRTKPEAPHET